MAALAIPTFAAGTTGPVSLTITPDSVTTGVTVIDVACAAVSFTGQVTVTVN